MCMLGTYPSGYTKTRNYYQITIKLCLTPAAAVSPPTRKLANYALAKLSLYLILLNVSFIPELTPYLFRLFGAHISLANASIASNIFPMNFGNTLLNTIMMIALLQPILLTFISLTSRFTSISLTTRFITKATMTNSFKPYTLSFYHNMPMTTGLIITPLSTPDLHHILPTLNNTLFLIWIKLFKPFHSWNTNTRNNYSIIQLLWLSLN